MVIHSIHPRPRAREHAWLMIELMVAIALLVVALLPLAYSFGSEKRFARSAYQRAIAMELVDGEAEVLAVGSWRQFAVGEHTYEVRAAAVTNLPPGRFVLGVKTDGFRLEWRPQAKDHGGPVVRELKIK